MLKEKRVGGNWVSLYRVAKACQARLIEALVWVTAGTLPRSGGECPFDT
jgi:hypothetical protein